jgi:hypothetical protein
MTIKFEPTPAPPGRGSSGVNLRGGDIKKNPPLPLPGGDLINSTSFGYKKEQ